MGYVTTEQIERAREFPVLDYVLSYEGNQYKRVGSSYRNKEHPSLAVSDRGFYWHSHGGEVKGKTALDYLTSVHGYGLVEAVCLLIGERPYEKGDKPPTVTERNRRGEAVISQSENCEVTVAPKARPPTPVKPPPEKIPFAAPLRNKDNRRVIAYLQSRGIDRDLIISCINQGSLYESLPYHNAVFTGKDENGKTRFAAMRGTISSFKRDADGSDKRFGFVIPPENPNSREIAVFEAPIDCLSHQTLCKQGFIPPFDGWRLSLGGFSVLALERFLEKHTEIARCLICTDNDEAGEFAAAKIAEIQGISSERLLPANENDWNDLLQSLLKAERTQNKARNIEIPGL
jgi:hypothetical protein